MEEHRTGRVRRHIEERRIADATLLQSDPRAFDVLVGMHDTLQRIASAVGAPRARVLWSGSAQIGADGVWGHRVGIGAVAAAVSNPNNVTLTLVAGPRQGSAPGRGAGVWQIPASSQLQVNATGPSTEWSLYGAAGTVVNVQLFGDPIAPSSALGGGGGPPGLSMGYFSGQTYGPPGVLGVQVLVPNDLSAMPFPVHGTHTFQGMGIWVTTAGVATTCVLRLGAYRDNGTGYPGTLIGDYGTVDATTTGIKTVTGISLPASTEILWLAVKMEATGLTSSPQVIGHTGNNAQTIFGVPGQQGSNPYIGSSWTTNGGFGAAGFPATFPAIGAGAGQAFADEGSWAPYLIA